jgi:hypothetical protein|tara:strand:- start:387 stop:497 length:111 start_codon:yes stop_codon:yes gene_type:complete
MMDIKKMKDKEDDKKGKTINKNDQEGDDKKDDYIEE